MALSYILTIIILVFLLVGLRLVYQYQRLVRFRLGKYKDVLEPGLRWVIPFVDHTEKIDLRVVSADVQPQESMTKDNVPLKVDAVVFFKVLHPDKAIIEIEDYYTAISQFSRAALRDVVGKEDLDTILSNREKVAEEIRRIVDKSADQWGIDVVEVKIQQVELPESMKRSMAGQAEAERERRATIIKSEGEVIAAKNLEKAAQTLKSPGALQLRTLTTLRDIASEPSQKIIIPIPTDLFDKIAGKRK
ncbi:slipin family protein [Candidatus Woesearchaeota archaeon]|nr:slipin family protein [Candidatus Woesearchaeota archaeon]